MVYFKRCKRTKRKFTLMVIVFSFIGCNKLPQLSDAYEFGHSPEIFPDYDGVTVPYNIAPLNFELMDSCQALFVKISSAKGENNFSFRKKKVYFPEKKWKKILSENKGDTVFITIYSKKGDKWRKYNPIHFFVSKDSIDRMLVYRKIMPGYQTWNTMGIYERDLSNFKEKLVLNSEIMPGTCMNCHTFRNNEPDSWLLHLRENFGGTIIFTNDNLKKIQTKTPQTFGSAGFSYWHPSGKYIAFSINKITQIFHGVGKVRAHALDMKSDMVIYDVEKNSFFTSPLINSPDAFEAFPCFSPNGKTLYYVSSPAGELPQDQRKMKYSLCSVSFDEQNGIIGNKVDTLISAKMLNKSVSIPRVSPDGRFIMLTQLDYGNFPAYNPEADLYLYDLKEHKMRALDAFNSNDVESWHCWSSNGRWVVFSSRRRDGLFMDVWIGYIDQNGAPRKPFLLPQKDPEFYDSFLFSFNLPELIKEPISVSPHRIAKVATKSKGQQAEFDTSH